MKMPVVEPHLHMLVHNSSSCSSCSGPQHVAVFVLTLVKASKCCRFLYVFLQLQEQLRSDQARLAAQQSQLESWQSQLADQQSQLEQLEAQAADALNEAREAAASAMTEREQVRMTGDNRCHYAPAAAMWSVLWQRPLFIELSDPALLTTYIILCKRQEASLEWSYQ